MGRRRRGDLRGGGGTRGQHDPLVDGALGHAAYRQAREPGRVVAREIHVRHVRAGPGGGARPRGRPRRETRRQAGVHDLAARRDSRLQPPQVAAERKLGAVQQGQFHRHDEQDQRAGVVLQRVQRSRRPAAEPEVLLRRALQGIPEPALPLHHRALGLQRGDRHVGARVGAVRHVRQLRERGALPGSAGGRHAAGRFRRARPVPEHADEQRRGRQRLLDLLAGVHQRLLQGQRSVRASDDGELRHRRVLGTRVPDRGCAADPYVQRSLQLDYAADDPEQVSPVPAAALQQAVVHGRNRDGGLETLRAGISARDGVARAPHRRRDHADDVEHARVLLVRRCQDGAVAGRDGG
ncbi:MAG: hypothetical protein BWY59_00808 [Verrucomicrobia bacterium ADurb.Bin345]|nr:MAG: hypothetical protein BWY59_00808 [Verrucomicrobia bacterium ADurb.Bin345]